MADTEDLHLMYMAQAGQDRCFCTRRKGVELPESLLTQEIDKLRALKAVFGSCDYRAYSRYSKNCVWECSSVQLYFPVGGWYKVLSLMVGSDGNPVSSLDMQNLTMRMCEEAIPRERPEYIVVSEENLTILLNCIVQYGRIARKDIRGTEGTSVVAVVLDLHNGTKDEEQVLLDYRFGDDVNRMPIIGELIEVRTPRVFDTEAETNYVLLEQFCNYSSLINFENGGMNAVVLCRLPGGRREYKAFVRFSVESCVNSVSTCKTDLDGCFYAIRIEGFEYACTA